MLYFRIMYIIFEKLARHLFVHHLMLKLLKVVFPEGTVVTDMILLYYHYLFVNYVSQYLISRT